MSEPIDISGNHVQEFKLAALMQELIATLKASDVMASVLLVMPGNAEIRMSVSASWSAIELDGPALVGRPGVDDTTKAATVNAMRLMAAMLEAQAVEARECANYLLNAYGFELVEAELTHTATPSKSH